MLCDFRDKGPTKEQVDKLNTRVIGSPGGPTEDSLPQNLAYCCRTNKDRMAVNDGIFAKHIAATHHKTEHTAKPYHTVCVKMSNLMFQKPKKAGVNEKKKFENMNQAAQDVLFSTCGDAHCKEGKSQLWDPMLKLYVGRPMMITENADVANFIANGSMCEFHSIELEPGVDPDNIESIVVDGYHVRCVDANQVSKFRVKMLDGVAKNEERIVEIPLTSATCSVAFPNLAVPPKNGKYVRCKRRMKFKQFPILCANARTCHKLQGQSVDNLFIVSASYVQNWMYVALSRVRTLGGPFLRPVLDYTQCKGMSMENLQFHRLWRETKQPPQRVNLGRYDD